MMGHKERARAEARLEARRMIFGGHPKAKGKSKEKVKVKGKGKGNK